jgi:site-specific recombinase XerD
VGRRRTERSGRRLASEVLAGLREHRRRRLETRLAIGAGWDDRDFVFTTGEERSLDSRHVTQALQRSLDRAGLSRQRFHDLRHAYATLLIEQGEELGVVSKIQGHSDLATTADVYAHLTMSMTQRAADRIDDVLGRRPAVG